MATYRLASSPFVHAPGIIKYALACDSRTFNKDTRDLLARAFTIGSGWPNLPFGVVLDIAAGKITPTFEDDVVVITTSLVAGCLHDLDDSADSEGRRFVDADPVPS